MQGKAERGGSIEVWRSGGKKYPSNQKCGGRCDKENQIRQWNEEGLTQNTGKTRQVSGFKWLDESLCFGVTETQHHHVAVWMHCVEVIFMQLAEQLVSCKDVSCSSWTPVRPECLPVCHIQSPSVLSEISSRLPRLFIVLRKSFLLSH